MGNPKHLVVIGAVAAGTSAAAKAKRTNPDLDVILLERDAYVSYGACGLPYYIAGLIPDKTTLIARTPAQFREQGVDVRTRHEVLEINTWNQTVRVADLEQGQEYKLPYDRLVIATGAEAFRPPVAGLDLPGVFTLRTLYDGLRLQDSLQSKPPTQGVVIVGGGNIGLEMAEAFRVHNLPVTIVELAPQLMVILDPDMSDLVRAEVERHGVRVLLNDGLVRCEGSGHIQKVVTQHNEVPADLALVAIGVRPNARLAQQIGVSLGAGKAIAVDEHMRTNIENVYAAGDCTEVTNQVTGRKAYIPLGSTANKQGKVAGANIAGMSCSFEGVVGTAVVKVFDLEVARTGLTSAEAEAQGFDVRAEVVEVHDRARYYPGAAPLHVKMIADRATGRLLGAQMIGQQGAAKRIDVLAAALYAKMTIEDVARLDCSYAPPFAPVWDPILVAANVMSRC